MEETQRSDRGADVQAETETTQGKGVDADTVSDPSLEAPDAQREEQSGADWSSEGGATREGPATHSGAARDQ
ncbi:hypothetical protein NODU109028_01510 [Nocardioides dubius]|uniref:Uncharacterized protein n=1 Tax=Nocardioides dubius TaxID=317019 RepID=A0ABN1TV83_9ACTN